MADEEAASLLTAQQVHALLQQAFDDVCGLYGRIDTGLGCDTAFAIGEAAGVLSKAKALVGRDIDNKRFTSDG